MQIYLHSRKHKILLSVASVLFAATVFATVFAMAHYHGDRARIAVNKEKTMYLSAFYPSSAPEQTTKDVQGVENAPEMNNEMQDNSKNNIFAQNNEKNTSCFCKTVRVKKPGVGVVSLPLEEYVAGCVLGEMPVNFEAQALMAQAVAVRSITVRKTLFPSASHPDADVCTDYNCCQSYISPDDERFSDNQIKKITDAVNATSGIVAVYDGLPIEAVYHASGGYSTLSSRDVWGGDVPYLVSVKSPEGENEFAKKEYFFSYGELSAELSEYASASVFCSRFGSNLAVSSGENNLADGIRVGDTVFDKSTVKKALRLASSDFEMIKTDEGVKIVSYGYGHRVGMSQHGANILAGEGMNYMDILKYYYTGITLDFLSEE